jgi:hypothetical protein
MSAEDSRQMTEDRGQMSEGDQHVISAMVGVFPDAVSPKSSLPLMACDELRRAGGDLGEGESSHSNTRIFARNIKLKD